MTLTAQAIVLGAPGRDGAERRQAACDAAALGLVLAVVLLLGVNVVTWGTPLYIAQEELGPFAPPPRPRLALGHAHPLASGLLLALAIAFVVNTSMAFAPKVAVTAALGLLLWLCNARGITVSLGPALLLGAFLTLRPSLLKSWAGFAVVVAGTGAAILALLHLDLSTLVSRGIGEDAGSLNGRTELWAYSFSLALKEALLGVGYYGTRFYLLTPFPFAGHTHNSLLEAFLGTGLPGAALCLGFLVFCVVRLLRTRDPLLGTVLPVVLVEGSLNPVVFIPSVGMFLLMLALFAAHPRGAR
jgi:O-antigen ligase